MFTGKFGVEMECFGVDRATVVAALCVAGVPTISSFYSGREYNQWQIKTDGSIDQRDGFEVVSRVLEGQAGLAEVQIVCDVLEALGAKVNKSCGMHIHHDASNWGIQKFRNLFKRFVKFEAALDSIQPESRRDNNNRYCKSMNILNYTAATISEIDKCKTVRQLSAMYGEQRYFKLNLQSFFRTGTVEFRNHAGTVNAEKVINYIRLTGAMVQDAKDNVAIKQFATAVSATQALDVMLSGMIRRNHFGKSLSKFYKKRQAVLANAQE
jgi:3,4-dihydroxy-2-butanone 4-phosphate synthase